MGILTQNTIEGEPIEADQQRWILSHFDHERDNRPKQKSYTRKTLKVLLENYNHKNKAAAPRFSFTRYPQGATRSKANVEAITGLVLDIDNDNGNIFAAETAQKRLDALGILYFIYSTTRHTPEIPRYRIILPLLAPVNPNDWLAFFERANHHLCDGNADPNYGTDYSHTSNLPNCLPGADKFSFAQDGKPLDPDLLPPLPKKSPQLPTDAPQSTLTPPNTNGHAAYAAKVLSSQLDKFRQCTNGTRNNGLNKTSFNLARWVGGGVFTYSEIQKELEKAALALGMKYDEDNILETIKSGMDKGVLKPKTIPPSKISYNGAATITSALKSDDQPETIETTEQAITITTGLPLDDIGNGQRFALMHKHRARHSYTWNSWAIYDGQRWVKDEQSEIDKLAKITARSIVNEADNEESESKRERIFNHAMASNKRTKRKTMIEDAISEPGMSIKAANFDKDIYLFNVGNGTLDLRTGELKPHNPDDLITKLANVIYDPKAQYPLFLDFLQKVFQGDNELIESMQRAMGYSLTGNTREQAFFIGHGGGSNGKSTLLQAVKRVMGDYALEAEPATIMVQKQEKMATDIADLHNIRLVITSESNDTQRLDEAKIKKMTGGEDLTGERKFEHPFKFKPQFKLFLATNHLPTIRGTDHSIWRRIVTVPFNTKFWKDGEDDAGIPELKADPRFLEKLETESSGILNWLLEGCLKWQESGLTIPAAVQAMKSEYRQEQDILSDFLATHCFIGAGFQATAKDILKRYEQWCETEGMKPISSTMLGKRLKEKGLTSSRSRTGNIWNGIGLRDISNE